MLCHVVFTNHYEFKWGSPRATFFSCGKLAYHFGCQSHFRNFPKHKENEQRFIRISKQVNIHTKNPSLETGSKAKLCWAWFDFWGALPTRTGSKRTHALRCAPLPSSLCIVSPLLFIFIAFCLLLAYHYYSSRSPYIPAPHMPNALFNGKLFSLSAQHPVFPLLISAHFSLGIHCPHTSISSPRCIQWLLAQPGARGALSSKLQGLALE